MEIFLPHLKKQKNVTIITDSDFQILPDISNKLINSKIKMNDSIKLKCIERIAAGDRTEMCLKNNEVVRIFTGARMPNNCNTVNYIVIKISR